MRYRGRFLVLTTSLIALTFGSGVRAQDENDRRPESRNTPAPTRPAEPSDLARENMGRVAASASQLQTVLIGDPGILVELKTWMAKEATDNGQVVDDSLLTDQAVFDRLDHDVVFRSVATRLVQRYGYLLPSVNPDSELAKQRGAIVNITDIHAERPLKGYAVYSIAKAGLVAMTRALALELGPAVRVNAVAPGAIAWPEDGQFPPPERERIVGSTPLARLGSPEEIARAVHFLATAPFVTGQVLAVDGGRSVYL